MKKTLVFIAFIAFIVIILISGCTKQSQVRNFGGIETIKLVPGIKLVNMTWKDSDLWFLTRPMKPGETPETYTFSENSSWGMFNGTLIIIEYPPNNQTTPNPK